MKERLRISQCMIVKNEEKNIRQALSWGRDIMWEQIVVDTGSTDRTPQIAASMGATVYEFPWTDDFSAAKNYAISKARGEWIAFLDADEVFVQGDEEKLWNILDKIGNAGFDGVATGWMQVDDEGKIFIAGTQIRVFANRPGLGYRRRIHEQLEYEDRTPLRVADATKELSILHRGYCGQAWKEKQLSRRNLALILKELEDHPGDHEMMGYMGDEYFAVEEWEEAGKWYRQSISAMPPVLAEQDQRSASTFLRLMDVINRADRGVDRNADKGADKNGDINPDREKEMLKVYGKAVGLLPKEADFDYVLGSYYAAREKYEKGALYLGKAFAKVEQYGHYNKAMLLVGNMREAYETQARCFLLSGQMPQAVNTAIAVLKAEPFSAQALYVLFRAFKGDGSRPAVTPGEALGVLGKIYDMTALKDRFFLMKVAEKAEWKEMEKTVLGMFTPEEKSSFSW